jgi:hypothetical protein
MSTPPTGEHHQVREQLRNLAAQTRDVLVPSNDLVTLLDYIDELEEAAYTAWEKSMGEDL